ncbi:MAG TPA: peptidyl-prolyl cis-trans isomerase [Candidatus Sulfotelmatobacter sp.]
MRKSWLVCLLLTALGWGQAPPGTPPPGGGPGGDMVLAPKAQAPPDTAAAVPPEAPVLTVKGVCPAAPKTAAAKTGTAKTASASAKTSPSDCKTVITKAEFEKLASGIAPNMTPQLRRQLASVLPRLIAMSDAAKKKGLEKTPRYEETLKFAKMQILTNELQRSIQEDAAKVPPEKIEAQYKEHPELYEQFNLDRLFVPRTKQPADTDAKDADKEEKLTDEQQKAKEANDKAKEEQDEQEMTKLADALHARAVAGEDFMKLQKEAFEAAGMKIESPTVNLPKLRRTGLPPGHVAVFDLKPGEVSQVISDSGGHYIYKVNSKEELPLDQVKEEIHNSLQSQNSKAAMEKVQSSFSVETNEMYFGPAGPGGLHPTPPPKMPNPHLAPAPTTPSTPPASQTPAPQTAPPAAKPN